jgi:hypothetical protein
MGGLRVRELWRAAGGHAVALYLVAVAASLFRVADQPSIDLDIGSTEVSLVPADLAFAVLAAVCVNELLRGRVPARSGRAVLLAAAAFAVWLGLTALPNGGTAIVGAGRLLELAVLTLGTAVLVRRSEHLQLLALALLAMTVFAVVVAVIGFLQDPGDRQGAFMGEHDLAALSGAALAIGVAATFTTRRLDWLTVVALVAGSLGVILGAALASLLGIYLLVAAVLAVAAVRGALHRTGIATVLVVLALTTAGTAAMRSGELGFLAVLAGEQEDRPGEFAASWSQRLIYGYVGLRVFADNPVAGTGWYPLLPPDEFASYLPDARERFSDQPARYFPPADIPFIPQQTPDQVLYELGAIGLALLLVLAALLVRTSWRYARAWPRGPDEPLAYLPLGWTASLAGVLAGAALFGGTPIAAIFWLTIGVVAAAPALAAAR